MLVLAAVALASFTTILFAGAATAAEQGTRVGVVTTVATMALVGTLTAAYLGIWLLLSELGVFA